MRRKGTHFSLEDDPKDIFPPDLRDYYIDPRCPGCGAIDWDYHTSCDICHKKKCAWKEKA